MNNFQKICFGIVAILAIIGCFLGISHKTNTLGDATVSNYPTWYYNGIQIGANGNIVQNVITGTCNLAGSGSVADRATTSTTCSVTGAKVGDKVFMTQKTVGGTGAYPIIAATVSSTNVVTAVLQNQTGGAAAPTTGAITAVQYLLTR